LLVDCGLYQGRQEIIDENAAAFGFDPAAIDCLLLTHGIWITVGGSRRS